MRPRRHILDLGTIEKYWPSHGLERAHEVPISDGHRYGRFRPKSVDIDRVATSAAVGYCIRWCSVDDQVRASVTPSGFATSSAEVAS